MTSVCDASDGCSGAVKNRKFLY